MKNILVTGGAGYIGSHTVVELTNAGYTPIIVDNFSNSDKSVIKRLAKITGKKITVHPGDFQNEKLLTKILTNNKIDGVIHFAAYKAVGESVSVPLKYYANNVGGIVTLLKVLQKHEVTNFVFSSSCTVYGEPDVLPITEEAPSVPSKSPYGTTKQMGEQIIKDTAQSSSLRALALRYFNPIGAHESALIGELPIGAPNNLVPYLTQTVAGIRKKLTVYGSDYPTPDGTCIRDYIHVVDLAKAHVKALEYLAEQKPGYYDVCNIGTGKGSSVLEIIQTFEKVTGRKVPHIIGPKREGDVTAVYAEVKRATDMLGWRADKTLEEGLADSWRWQESIK